MLITMLSDTDAVLEAMEGADGALAGVAEGTIWLQMSTVGLSGTERCAELAERSGLGFVDAPVLGTKEPAEQGKLVVLASGPGALRDRLQPIFDAVAQRTMWVGEAGRGTRLKVVVNSWILSVVEGAAETIALAEGLGLDADLFLEAVKGGPLDSALPAQTRAPRWPRGASSRRSGSRSRPRTRDSWRRPRSATGSTFRFSPRCGAGSTRPFPSTATRT